MADPEKSFIEKVNIVAANIAGVAAVNENLPAILSAKDQADLAALKAAEATASAAEIKELSVQVSTLSPSEPASALYDPLTGVLNIAIPKGDAGEQGLQGIAGADGADGISAYQVALNNGFVGTEVEWIASLKGEQGPQGIKGDTGAQGDAGINGTNGTSDTNFTKPHQGAPLVTKASVSTITIPIGTSVKAGANIITVSGAAYTLSLNSAGVGALDTGAKAAGTDYYVYALEAGGFILSANATNPTGYTTANSRQIGGFHYGVIPEAFTAINNIVAADATKIAGINAYSLWDLKFKPVCDPKGMVFILGRWYDIYLLNTD